MSEQTLDHKMQNQLIERDTFSRVWQRNTAAFRQYRFNHSFVNELNRRNRYMKALIHAKGLFQIKQPFYCRYGSHIYVGRDFTCGHYTVFEDEGRIVIGDHVQMGNHVRVLTVKPLMDPMLRQKHMECIADVEIEDHVYIGHNVTILPGVHIGSCSIIGDGCVVREDVKSGSVVIGDPVQCEEALSAQLAELLDQAKLCEESSKWDQLMDHINMDKMDQAVRVLGFALGVYMSYEIVKELLARKAKLEEKKALVNQYLSLAEKLASKKQLLAQKKSGKLNGKAGKR